MRRFTIIAVTMLSSAGVHADVVDSNAGGFTVRHELAIRAPAETVWRTLVGHVAEWWHPDHTYSGTAAGLYIEPRALGCFCERLGEEGVVVHMAVTFANPGRMLRLTGGLGPLGLMGVDGNLVFSLNPGESVTYLNVTYAVGGYSPNGLDSIAPAVDGVIGEQAARLRRLVESGSPAQ